MAAFHYFGGKWRLAPKIIKLFPPHDAYLEPCFGSGAVLARKLPSKIEIVNDLDGRVVNFFRVLRERPKELIRLLDLTPYAREEFELCVEPVADPLEDARRLYVVLNSGRRHWTGAKKRDWQRRFSTATLITPTDNFRKVDQLYEWAARLKNVQIERGDALDLIIAVRGHGYLIYFDPPYLRETRTTKSGYSYEPDRQWHIKAAALLKDHDGGAIVSGYASDLYKELYEANGWRTVDFDVVVPIGAYPSPRTERLWLSPNIPEWNPRLL